MTFIQNKFPLTAFGDLRVAELSPQVQLSFEYTVTNTELNVNTVVAGGTVTQADAMAVITTSTTTGSSAQLRSKAHAKYRAGLGGLARFTALFTTGVAATEQYVGIMDEVGSGAAFKNGLAVGFDGATFGFHRFVNDSKVTVAQTAWDDPLDGTGASGMTIDPTKLNVWAIRFQFLGAGAIQLLVEDDSTGDLVVVHEILFANKNTSPHSYNPNYHLQAYANNKATTSNLIVNTASVAYFVEGKTGLVELQQPQFSSGEKTKLTVTTEVAVFTIRSKSTYASKTNFIATLLEYVSASVEAGATNNLANIRLVKNATLGGSPSYADINTTDSTIDIDVAGTTVGGGKELINIPLAGKNAQASINLVQYLIGMEAGDTITVAASSANSATIKSGLLWKELF